MNETTTVKRESEGEVVVSGGFSLQRIVKAQQKGCGQLVSKEFFNCILSSLDFRAAIKTENLVFFSLQIAFTDQSRIIH